MSNQQHYYGEDGWSKISDYLNLIKADKVLLITGNAMYQTSGAAQALEPILRHRELTHLICTKPNPCVEDLTHLIEQTGSERAYDAILAVGGGSVIDLAKLLKVFSLKRSLVDDFFDQQNPEALRPLSVPLIAVPSTAGSGSEATRFAVVYKDGQKQSVEHDDLLPDVSVVIPSLLASVPARVAAASGMDALCQGIESYWSIHSSDASRKLAGEAISIGWSWLVEAVHERTPESLEQMAKASHLAGRAINMTKTTATSCRVLSNDFLLWNHPWACCGIAHSPFSFHSMRQCQNMTASMSEARHGSGTSWMRSQKCSKRIVWIVQRRH